MYDVMPALDFNAVHSGDPIARAYFGHAAAAIRREKREAEHWRRRCVAEQASHRETRRDADTLAILLKRLLDEEDADLAPAAAIGGK